jgi:hypothetical protein
MTQLLHTLYRDAFRRESRSFRAAQAGMYPAGVLRSTPYALERRKTYSIDQQDGVLGP